MKTAGIRELEQNASAVVAVAGEVVTITDRGRPVARLVPMRPPRRAIDEVGQPPRLAGERPLSDVLEEMRQSERW
jgi:prevent-host-death family protein